MQIAGSYTGHNITFFAAVLIFIIVKLTAINKLDNCCFL